MLLHPTTIADALSASRLDHLDARLLLQHVLDVEHAYVSAHAEHVLSKAESERFLALREQRLAGEPIAYLVGWREFYGRRFCVDRSVLIPRPETELLVELALERMPRGGRARILDLGTGSGNIALTLALERPDAEIWAVDASQNALARAQSNGEALQAANIGFYHSDWFDALAQARFDLIVSNPPYIASADPHLAQGDVRFEPREALIAGPDGLACIRHIVAEAYRHLKPGGWIVFEHGYDQGPACMDLLGAGGYSDCFGALDLASQPRVSGGRRATGA